MGVEPRWLDLVEVPEACTEHQMDGRNVVGYRVGFRNDLL